MTKPPELSAKERASKSKKSKDDILSYFNDIEGIDNVNSHAGADLESEGALVEVDELLNQIEGKSLHNKFQNPSMPIELVPKDKLGPSAVRNGETLEKSSQYSETNKDLISKDSVTLKQRSQQGSRDGETGRGWLWSSISNLVKHEDSQPVSWEQKLLGVIKSSQGNLSLSELSKSFSQVLNVVAPPISAHELLVISFSARIPLAKGYANTVFNIFKVIMNEVEGGQVVVESGDDTAVGDNSFIDEIYDSSVAAAKVAKDACQRIWEELEEKQKYKAQWKNVPIAVSKITLSTTRFSANEIESLKSEDGPQNCLLVRLEDRDHSMVFSTISQAFPVVWYDWIQEETLPCFASDSIFQPKRWVKELITGYFSNAVQVLAQRYVLERMGLSEVAKVDAIQNIAQSST